MFGPCDYMERAVISFITIFIADLLPDVSRDVLRCLILYNNRPTGIFYEMFVCLSRIWEMKRFNSYAAYAVAVHGILPISKPSQVIPAESTSVSWYRRRSTPAKRTELLSAKQKRHAIEFDDLRR